MLMAQSSVVPLWCHFLRSPGRAGHAYLEHIRVQCTLIVFFAALFLLSFQAWSWNSDNLAKRMVEQGARPDLALRLERLVNTDASQPEMTRIKDINSFFNSSILFGDDALVWGQSDYWASPSESLAKGHGDCEDYAIAKYFSLIATGVPVNKLRMVYVKATLGTSRKASEGIVQAHMILAYYERPDAEPYILDNLINDVLPASARSDLVPVFSFNGEGIWNGTQNSMIDRNASNRLSRWRDVVTKARQEGF